MLLARIGGRDNQVSCWRLTLAHRLRNYSEARLGARVPRVETGGNNLSPNFVDVYRELQQAIHRV